MSFLSLLLRNLRYYRKPYVAILAGTVISTAVLTGALIVGDSVRYSLENLTDIRLGKAQIAIQSGERFFRQQLADDLSVKIKSPVASVLHLEGIANKNDQNSVINRVEVYGFDNNFIKFWNTSIPQLNDNEAIISRNTAEKLKLNIGDEFLLKIHKQIKASENAPFISEKEPVITIRSTVKVIEDDAQMGRFSLKSNQSAPYNIFIPLAGLSRKLDLGGNANLLLIGENEAGNNSPIKIDSTLKQCWQPEDIGLEFRVLAEYNSFEIRSSRIFIEDHLAKAIQKEIPDARPVFTYLVNAISSNKQSTPYSFVTAEDLNDFQLSEHEILISDWLANDLSLKAGDSLQLRYFKMGALRKLTEDSTKFIIKTVLPITNTLFDRTLMPDFPGMSDAGNCRDWETGAPINLDKIRDKDELYWNHYRGTPKAFISLAAGQKLWNNAFGHATAFRFTADSAELKFLKNKLMKQLVTAENGLRIQNVYAEGKLAATNSTDFGSLFLYLSFFIIVAAISLIALLFSLHAQKRMAETAILATIGFRKKEIIRILFLEAALVVLIGSLIGVIFGIFYTKLMLLGLNTLWQDAVRTTMLEVHLLPTTILTGFLAGVFTALFALLFVLLRNLRKPLSVLIKGNELSSPLVNRRKKKVYFILAIILFVIAGVIALVSMLGKLPNLETNFLIVGGLILLAGISLLNSFLLSPSQTSIYTQGFFASVMKNVRLKKQRTLTAISLLAIGTFSVIITGANRKTFYGTENASSSGSGGFLFLAESTVPVLNDLNSQEGKAKYGLADEEPLQNVHFIQMLSLDGNDASCLNLNQVSQPKILGITPQIFNQRNSFSFTYLDKSVNIQHPWLTLNHPLSDGVIPAFADQTVITWGMQKKIGDTLLYTDEKGRILKVKIMGGMENSVFQGNILISAELFRQHFPSVSGSKVMLVDGEFSKRSEIQSRLEYLFQDYGMVVTPSSEKLAQFNSVENTYLTVFMMLGGLGIIIGTIGLGIVLLRNLHERKQEIAIYQAIGFKQSFIFKLVFTENLFILLSGIAIGLISSFAGILPSFISPSFQLPTSFLLLILLLILLSGFAWIYFPVKSALRKNLIQVLRKE